MSRALLFLLGALVILFLIVLAVRFGAEEVSLDAGDYASIIGLSALALLTGSSVLGMFRGRAGEAVQAILGWLGIVAVLAVVYTYRFEFEQVGRRVLANVVPGMASTGVTGSNEVTVPRGRGGMYAVAVSLNGARGTTMLIDTGASTLVLTDRDARLAGLRPDQLSYVVPVQTANGQAMAAAATIERVSIGPIEVRNVRALVSRPEALTTSLLGHTVLDRLASYEVRDGRMVLRGRD